MERFTKAIFLFLVLALVSCKEPAPIPDPFNGNLSQQEQMLVGDWQYEKVVALGIEFDFADDFMEPQQTKDPGRGEREVLSRRWVNYDLTRNYQLRWNRSEYQLGTPEYPNWQPRFGYWNLNATEDSLYFNRGMYYEQAYAIRFEGTKMIRTSLRIMAADSDENYWSEGDTLRFREVFIRKNQ